MTTTATAPPPACYVLCPSEAAARLGVSVPVLRDLIKRHKAEFVQQLDGHGPDVVKRGAPGWGMTEAQVAALLEAMACRLQTPDAPAAVKLVPVCGLDGKKRLRKRT
jgi:hypothetical protein